MKNSSYETCIFWAEHRAKIGITVLARSQERTNLLVEIGNLVILVPAT